jgi:hypothetical protein
VEIFIKLSAPNAISGTVVDVAKGQTTAHVQLDIGGGQTITTSITNEAVPEPWAGVREAWAGHAPQSPITAVVSKPVSDPCPQIRWDMKKGRVNRPIRCTSEPRSC